MEQRLSKLGFKKVNVLLKIYYLLIGKEVKAKETGISNGVRLNLHKIKEEYFLSLKYIQINTNNKHVIIRLGNTFYRKLLS